MKKVVFLDRDGTVSRDSLDHIKSWEEFHFLPNGKEGVSFLTKHDFKIIFITNQSVIARGMVTPKELDFIHNNMVKEIEASGGKVEKIYFCPHHPDDGCNCRKPRPGLLLKAIDENDVDPSKSYMVGDRIMDVQVGRSVGCKTVLLKNDRGLKELEKADIKPDYIADDLLDAAKWINSDYKKLEQ
jgi:histidinol-phosphate phosphatase family protein